MVTTGWWSGNSSIGAGVEGGNKASSMVVVMLVVVWWWILSMIRVKLLSREEQRRRKSCCDPSDGSFSVLFCQKSTRSSYVHNARRISTLGILGWNGTEVQSWEMWGRLSRRIQNFKINYKYSHKMTHIQHHSTFAHMPTFNITHTTWMHSWASLPDNNSTISGQWHGTPTMPIPYIR